MWCYLFWQCTLKLNKGFLIKIQICNRTIAANYINISNTESFFEYCEVMISVVISMIRSITKPVGLCLIWSHPDQIYNRIIPKERFHIPYFLMLSLKFAFLFIVYAHFLFIYNALTRLFDETFHLGRDYMVKFDNFDENEKLGDVRWTEVIHIM